MIRTQVYLPCQTARQIKNVAARARKSQAEVIREALSQGLNTLPSSPRGSATGLTAVAQLGRRLGVKGPHDLSVTIDRMLYDE